MHLENKISICSHSMQNGPELLLHLVSTPDFPYFKAELTLKTALEQKSS